MNYVFVPKESRPGEKRVAATPETVAKLVERGVAVHVEPGAGDGAMVADARYREAGGVLVQDPAEAWSEADVVLGVAAPTAAEAARLKEGALRVSFLDAVRNLDAVRELIARKASTFAMELVPRITRAQRMDALSSQANVAGYKAVVLAADRLPKYFPLLMTAAGTVRPARVVVFGAGVAGLQAIATARRLGAVVEATDIRVETKEQVESLGGRFILVEDPSGQKEASVYAQEASEEYLRLQREAVAASVEQADVVVTTAQVPGKRAPVLVSEEMVAGMKPGSVVVDLAAPQGGNCALTVPGEEVVRHGVLVAGPMNLPAEVAVHASELYARNVLAVLELLLPKPEEEGRSPELVLDLDDEIVAESLAVLRGEVRNPLVAEALGQTAAS